jgi:hypothetical protein
MTDLSIPDLIQGVWELGPAILVSVVDEHEDDEVERIVRITVTRALPEGRFWSSYEEEVVVSVDGKWRPAWAKADLVPVSGETAEECLQNALDVVAKSARRVEAADGDRVGD